jgi:hypothetical protein
VIETGGLDASVTKQVLSSSLPSLEHLELWLGAESYGATTTVEDLEPLFSGALFPRLRYLGLRDSELADAIAERIAQSPLLERIEVLDLSLGTLGDKGAEALLASPAVRRLRKLDLHHHYMSKDVLLRLHKLGPEVDLSGAEDVDVGRDGEEYRYVAVGE